MILFEKFEKLPMFKDCISIIEIDLSNFNTSKVSNMSNKFDNCATLKS